MLAMIVIVLTITTVAAQQVATPEQAEEAAPAVAADPVAPIDEEADTPESPDAVSTEPIAPDNGTDYATERPGVFREIHFRDASLRQVFQLLSSEGQKNIVATKEVTGKVTADLYGVTFQEALDAVVKSAGYVYEVDGNFIYVMTVEQQRKANEAKRQLTVGTFRLAYLTAADAKVLIAPALSRDGMVAVTPSSTTGISTSKTDGGGNTYSQDDVLVVRDYNENIIAVESILRELDVKPEQVMIEATILRARLLEGMDLGIDFNVLAGVNVHTMGTKDTWGDFRTNFTSAVPSGGLSVGFFSNNVDMFLRALESITDTTVLANPKLLVVNKQRGEVMVGKRDGYLTTVTTQTATTQSVQFLETGTRLIVRPFIGRDGYVRMEIHPEDSSGSVSLVGTSALPNEQTTEVTSNVLVRDGHTIVIGGLFRESTETGRGQIPLLGDIPFLGAAFRNTKDRSEREEVIILITPRIIRQEVDEATSAQIADDIERMRVGARNGMQWFGRPKLAQTYLRWAKEAIAQGKTDKALCHLDMALNLQPRMIEAIHLKERIKDRAYWARQDRPSTARIVIQQMMMQDLGMPVELIITPCKPRDVAKIDPGIQAEMNLMPREWLAIEEQVRCSVKSCKQIKDEAKNADEETELLESPSDQAVREESEALDLPMED